MSLTVYILIAQQYPLIEKLVPEPHFNKFIVILNSGHVVIKDSGNIVLWKYICIIADEKRSLANITISKKNNFHIDSIIISRLLFHLVYYTNINIIIISTIKNASFFMIKKLIKYRNLLHFFNIIG